MIELRDATVAREWLCAGLCAARVARPEAALLAEVTPWLAGVLGELGALPPAGMVVDFGRTLLSGSAVPPQGLEIDDPQLRSILRVYETELLSRLQGEPRLPAASDAIARLPPDMRPEAVAAYISALLARIGFDSGASLQAGVVRRLASMLGDEAIESGLRGLANPELLVEGYTQLVRASRHAGQLITEADVFVLEHLPVLRAPAQRLEVAQIADVAARLSQSLPKRMRRQSPPGRVPTAVEDEAQYPVGGFSSIETSGSMENLVTSELVYMDDDVLRAAGEMDLFEVRYVEGELLYYSRDESVLTREQRVFFFVLQPELVRARFKDRDVPWQRLVIVLGLLLCLVQRLSEWLNEAGLQFRVIFLHDAQSHSTPLSAEKALCELLLSEWIETGVASVLEAPSWSDVSAQAAGAARSAQVDVLSVGFGQRLLAPDARIRLTSLDVSNAQPDIGESPASESTWSAWLRATGQIARRLC